MPEFSCSKYYTYDEITDLLEGWVEDYGDVCELSSIGTSLEGRELWLLTGEISSTAPPGSAAGILLEERYCLAPPGVPSC